MDDLFAEVQEPEEEKPQQQEEAPKEDKLAAMEAKLTELMEAKKALEQKLAELEQPKPQPEPAAEEPADVYSEIAEIKLERYLGQNELARKYESEIRTVLAGVKDARLRSKDETITATIRYVLGSHVDELVKRETPVQPPENASNLPEPPKPKEPVIKLSETQKTIAAMWFDGDLAKAKSNILGMEE